MEVEEGSNYLKSISSGCIGPAQQINRSAACIASCNPDLSPLQKVLLADESLSTEQQKHGGAALGIAMPLESKFPARTIQRKDFSRNISKHKAAVHATPFAPTVLHKIKFECPIFYDGFQSPSHGNYILSKEQLEWSNLLKCDFQFSGQQWLVAWGGGLAFEGCRQCSTISHFISRLP